MTGRRTTGRNAWHKTAPAMLLAAAAAAGLGGCAGGAGQTGAVTAGPGGAGPGEPAPSPTGTPLATRIPGRPAPGAAGTTGLNERIAASAAALSRAAREQIKKREQDLRDDVEKQVGRHGTFVMPRLVGRNLQDAQNRLQARGSYLLDQTDATGAGRLQIDDDRWRVCGQHPAAGATVKVTVRVRLDAVRLTERCP